ncbi:helix-turn-helix domain-containing protein [Leifsonia shinshuensis]|uniref:Helix-turn-helix domain-containing protein n=1 Tax=Leifsonia shinshuensis TaxID=150026 RepID=A0A7G6YGA4_9MICO|nr:helix-turn-helix transcriptional regulator [Leifsonia shinshuensis]QNE37519.1 helix-turn-helix domain-containing protein [Leifsonia shinshuensis]
MSTRDDVREFLMSRRANITPAAAGIQASGDDRRVPGLRREEVAQLAGVSVDYYTRLEKGHIAGVSESVLNAVAAALQLSIVEREYLLGLARTAASSSMVTRPAERPSEVRDSVQQLLDAMTLPAIVQNPQQDVLAANLVGRAIYAPVFDLPGTPNLARFVYLDPRARDYWVDWELSRRTSAAILRFEAGRDPLNEQLTALIGELSTLSPHFRQDWARNDVHEHRTGTKAFRHPELGVVEVAFNVFETPGTPGQKLVTYSPLPGSDTGEKFALLASWAASHNTTEH